MTYGLNDHNGHDGRHADGGSRRPHRPRAHVPGGELARKADLVAGERLSTTDAGQSMVRHLRDNEADRDTTG